MRMTISITFFFCFPPLDLAGLDNDKLKAWDKVNPDKRVCSLCEGQEDSHEHLFFECSFSKQIWQQVKCYAGLSGSDFSIDNIIQDIIPFAMKRSSKSICAKLVVAAASFFIWQERNNRLFRSEKRSVDNVVACIFNTVRLKLVSFTWKKSRAVLDIMKLWKIESIRLQD
ncbi:reverse transcriptase domain, reverse transcriptase zinc-binding domain protein [Tanacetum coccineum]